MEVAVVLDKFHLIWESEFKISCQCQPILRDVLLGRLHRTIFNFKVLTLVDCDKTLDEVSYVVGLSLYKRKQGQHEALFTGLGAHVTYLLHRLGYFELLVSVLFGMLKMKKCKDVKESITFAQSMRVLDILMFG